MDGMGEMDGEVLFIPGNFTFFDCVNKIVAVIIMTIITRIIKMIITVITIINHSS